MPILILNKAGELGVASIFWQEYNLTKKMS